jgi:hypothetical protein
MTFNAITASIEVADRQQLIRKCLDRYLTDGVHIIFLYTNPSNEDAPSLGRMKRINQKSTVAESR